MAAKRAIRPPLTVLDTRLSTTSWLIFIELFKQFSPITFIYYIIVILAIISICVFISLCNLIYFNLLKNYVEKEEVQKIDLKYVFLGELLNPLYLIVCIIAFSVLTYFII